jgi:hypothetical protein
MQKTNGVYGAASPPFHLAHYQSDTLRKTCTMLSRKIERPCGFLALSGIPVSPQNLCGVSGRACTPIYGAFRGMPNVKCHTFNNIISAPELHFILRLEWFAIACTDPASIPGEAPRGSGENDDCQ